VHREAAPCDLYAPLWWQWTAWDFVWLKDLDKVFRGEGGQNQAKLVVIEGVTIRISALLVRVL
jgi:hypothetical protein